jgi:putative ATP-dependent endonuclease of OLD family
LCRKAILVEGPSDELIVQKAFIKSKGKLPIEDEVDVISVGTSFLRFLEIAQKIKKPVVIVTDNDGDFANKVTKKYQQYASISTIKVCADQRNDFKTLEPQMAEANKDQLGLLLGILGINDTDYPEQSAISDYMQNNKTDCALKIFESNQDVRFPQYVLDAITWEYVQE